MTQSRAKSASKLSFIYYSQTYSSYHLLNLGIRLASVEPKLQKARKYEHKRLGKTRKLGQNPVYRNQIYKIMKAIVFILKATNLINDQ